MMLLPRVSAAAAVAVLLLLRRRRCYACPAPPLCCASGNLAAEGSKSLFKRSSNLTMHGSHGFNNCFVTKNIFRPHQQDIRPTQHGPQFERLASQISFGGPPSTVRSGDGPSNSSIVGDSDCRRSPRKSEITGLDGAGRRAASPLKAGLMPGTCWDPPHPARHQERLARSLRPPLS